MLNQTLCIKQYCFYSKIWLISMYSVVIQSYSMYDSGWQNIIWYMLPGNLQCNVIFFSFFYTDILVLHCTIKPINVNVFMQVVAIMKGQHKWLTCYQQLQLAMAQFGTLDVSEQRLPAFISFLSRARFCIFFNGLIVSMGPLHGYGN